MQAKRTVTDYEAEAAAFLLHVAGEGLPQQVREHYWRVWFDIHRRAYALNGIERLEAEGRLRRFFAAHHNKGDNLGAILGDGVDWPESPGVFAKTRSGE
jgi:hypothetical protein